MLGRVSDEVYWQNLICKIVDAFLSGDFLTVCSGENRCCGRTMTEFSDCDLCDLQWQSLGYLNPEAKKYTPALTEFSKGAQTFLHSHVSYSLCTAARASMMTGMSPLRTGVTAHQVPVESGIITIPEYLKDLGYRTGLIGKIRHTIPFRHEAFDLVVGPDKLAMGRSPEAFYAEVLDLLTGRSPAPTTEPPGRWSRWRAG